MVGLRGNIRKGVAEAPLHCFFPNNNILRDPSLFLSLAMLLRVRQEGEKDRNEFLANLFEELLEILLYMQGRQSNMRTFTNKIMTSEFLLIISWCLNISLGGDRLVLKC